MRIRTTFWIALVALALGACLSEEDAAKRELRLRSIPFTEEAFVRHAAKGEAWALAFFLAAGMDPNTSRGANGDTPLIAASKLHHAAAVELLLEGGADPNIAATNGVIPLFASLLLPEEGNETSETLVSHGADPSAQLENGATLMQVAARLPSAHAVEFLLAHGADPNQRAPDTLTPLMVAVSKVKMFNQNTEIVEALLNHGADVDAEVSNGKTVFDMATTEQVRSLLRAAQRRR